MSDSPKRTANPDAESLLIVGTIETLSRAAASACEARSLRGAVLGCVVVGEHRPEMDMPAWFCGIPNLGHLDQLEEILSRTRAKTALLCLPGAMSTLLRRTQTDLERLGLTVRHLPLIEDIAAGLADPGIRAGAGSVDPAVLFDRPARKVDPVLVRSVVGGKRVLITGAGGSIGSELARICAAHDPSLLILMDRSDNALFEIDRQLQATHPGVNRRVVLHDVVDSPRTLERMEELQAQVVFHAAAHKHVPLMEDHPAAAVNNNLFGTVAVADAAIATGVERFVMISTDKAVNPTSVMGATKRMAELYVRSLNECQTSTRFGLVRFGNVLGSACSVLPIWSKQIAEGGPVTVTDPEMTRYFMTIPEAASLVIQSAALVEPEADGQSGREVFVLDMGEPVRIMDLATRFVAAHGLRAILPGSGPKSGCVTPGVRIQFTGKRPGEKLHEELVYDIEQLAETAVPGVRAWAGNRPVPEEVAAMLSAMSRVRNRTDVSGVIDAIGVYIPQINQTESGQSQVCVPNRATLAADAA